MDTENTVNLFGFHKSTFYICIHTVYTQIGEYNDYGWQNVDVYLLNS
jgi:hypothetical protein